jgi:hypothetical protein
MLNRIDELRNKTTERAIYYSRIDFPNLACEFTQLVNILNEMEAIVRDRDELKAQVLELESKLETTRPTYGNPADVKIGSILQTYATEEKEKETNEI